MTILVSPAEPPPFHPLGPLSSLPEAWGADFLIGYRDNLIGVQRKQFPADFLASLSDGRLSTSLVGLTHLAGRVLVIEGRGNWTTDGWLVGHEYGQGKRFSRESLHGLMLSAQFELGVSTYLTEDVTDTIALIRTIATWAAKPSHESLFTRPSGPSQVSGSERRRWSVRDDRRWLLQGFPGVGPTLASDILDHFDGHLPMTFTVPTKTLLDVPGLGPGRVAKLTAIVPAVDTDPKESTE